MGAVGGEGAGLIIDTLRAAHREGGKGEEKRRGEGEGGDGRERRGKEGWETDVGVDRVFSVRTNDSMFLGGDVGTAIF